VEDVIAAQRRRIVFMLLKGDIYGLPGSDGTVRKEFGWSSRRLNVNQRCSRVGLCHATVVERKGVQTRFKLSRCS